MKKLEKLTLKEMKDSGIVISCEEEQRSIVAGSGYWITGSDGTQCYVEMDDIEVTAPKLVQIGDTGIYIPASCISTIPPVDQGSIGGSSGNNSIVKWYDDTYGDNPANPGGPFPPGSIGHTILEYLDWIVGSK